FMRLGNFLMKMQKHGEKQDEKQVTGDRLQGTAGEKQVAEEQVSGDRLQGTAGEPHVLVANAGEPVRVQAQNEGASGDVDEKTDGQVPGANYQVPVGEEPVDRNGLQTPADQGMAAAAGGSVRGGAQNEGASGDIDENTDPGKIGPGLFCPAAGQWGLATPDKLS
ncbi:MAG: hypothetical protein P4N24_06875, partial [Acidobacteriota bacterium]|nr:hypothetical protein [Acidobacteriota bacterium]